MANCIDELRNVNSVTFLIARGELPSIVVALRCLNEPVSEPLILPEAVISPTKREFKLALLPEVITFFPVRHTFLYCGWLHQKCGVHFPYGPTI